jgi:hypothetical protein
MPTLDEIYTDVLALKTKEKLILVDKILTSIYPSNKGVETLWGNEAEERVMAYNQENISAKDANDVFTKYDN